LDELLSAVAKERSAATLTGSIRKDLENMVIAKVYPSTKPFDFIRDGGVTMNKLLGSVECNAKEFYPKDATPTNRDFEHPVGHGLKGKVAKDASDAE
jgi:hypothetical protein